MGMRVISEPKSERVQPLEYIVDATIYVSEDWQPDTKDEDTRTQAIWKGKSMIAHEEPQTAFMYQRILLAISELQPDSRAKIAILGLGTGVLPRILGISTWSALDIYEIEPSIITWAEARYQTMFPNWNCIPGDWRETLTGTYDLIIYDTGEWLTEPVHQILYDHLADGGSYIFSETLEVVTKPERVVEEEQPIEK